jgi:hypothetical protein
MLPATASTVSAIQACAALSSFGTVTDRGMPPTALAKAAMTSCRAPHSGEAQTHEACSSRRRSRPCCKTVLCADTLEDGHTRTVWGMHSDRYLFGLKQKLKALAGALTGHIEGGYEQ